MKLLRYSILFLYAATSYAQSSGKFELLARYRGLGGLVASIVAPGKEPGTERLYASFLYNDNTIDVIAVNPDTGAADVFHSPIQGDFGARNIAMGPDGNVYLGTLPNAHFLKLDRAQGKLIDLGQPSPGEQYIWDVAFGPDNKLYGVTYPGCKLVRYDPASGKLEDLGKLDPTEQYGRWVVGGHDGFVYAGIGTSKANIAAYNVRTGEHHEILPADAQTTGTAKVYRGVDGNIYGAMGQRLFRLENGTAVELKSGETVAAAPQNVLKDGRTVAITPANGTVTVTDPKTHAQTVHKLGYDGNSLQLFRVGFGPDGVLYGSAVLPIHFVRIDTQQHQVDDIGDLGGGEVYSFLNHDGKLLIGTYSGIAPLMSYTPGEPFHPDATGNPALLKFPGSEAEWRPLAMIDGPDGRVYVGAIAGYGELEQPLVAWRTQNNDFQLYKDIAASKGVIKDQSIASLTVWKQFIVGGTTIYGGGGSHPTQTSAKLFLWNTAANKLEFSTVPVPGAGDILDLIAAPNGLIYGIAGSQWPAMLQQQQTVPHAPLTLFVFDPQTRQVKATKPLPFADVIYNSVAIGKDGRIWGLAEDGIFTIDTKTNDATLVAHAPEKITGGFEIRDGAIYFISESAVYRYKM